MTTPPLPSPVPDPQAAALARRTRLAAESILEDESLTADLDDEAAQVLLDWGVSLAEQAARRLASPQEETAAAGAGAAGDAVLAARLKLLRRLLRLAARWAAGQAMDDQAQAELLDHIVEMGVQVYDEPAASASSRTVLTQAEKQAPAHQVADLRAFIEGRVEERSVVPEESGLAPEEAGAGDPVAEERCQDQDTDHELWSC